MHIFNSTKFQIYKISSKDIRKITFLMLFLKFGKRRKYRFIYRISTKKTIPTVPSQTAKKRKSWRITSFSVFSSFLTQKHLHINIHYRETYILPLLAPSHTEQRILNYVSFDVYQFLSSFYRKLVKYEKTKLYIYLLNYFYK